MLQRRADRGKQAQEERVVELAGVGRQHQADRLAAAMAQAAGKLVGAVVDPLRLREHARARRGGDLGEAAEGARHRGDRQVESLGDGAQGHLDWTFQIVLT